MRIKNLENLISKLEREGFLSWTKNVYKQNSLPKKAGQNSVEIYLVGGAVRDALLGKKFDEITDYDFVVRGISLDDLGKELKKLGKVDLVGKTFGVYKFIPKGKKLGVAYDIALPRKEISFATGAYRDFKIDYDEKLKIESDLGRRDFTVNAMAYELKQKKLVDEFNGVEDLENKIIRTVGNAYQRFEEDYSRMLRGIRFVCQLDFKIEEVTWQAIVKLITHINDLKSKKISNIKIQNLELAERVVPYEVIASELLKAFVSNPIKAFDLYDKSGVFKELMPELLKMKDCPQPENWHSEGDVWEHTRLCLKNLQSNIFKKRFQHSIIFNGSKLQIANHKLQKNNNLIKAELVMAALWHDAGKPYTIQTPEKDGTDRIRFNNHDNKSGKLAKSKFEELRLSSAPEFSFDADRAVWLVAKHHLFDSKTAKEMKNSTIEKYFFGDNYSGEDLLKLGFIDILSSIWRENEDKRFDSFELMVKRINQLKKLGKDKKLPKPFLNGDEVMRILKIKAGKEVGEILEDLREKQLNGEVKNKKEAKIEIEKLRK